MRHWSSWPGRELVRSGLLLLPLTGGLTACAGRVPRSTLPPGRPVVLQTLVVMLDGVPFQVMDSLWNAGHFPGFQAPAAVVSTFPSVTNVAFRDIWSEPAAPGYEDRYFDPRRNQVVGGVLRHFFPDQDEGFLQEVDVSGSGLADGFAYLWPGPGGRLELGQVARAVEARAGRDTLMVAYIVSTDAIAHRSGRAALVDHLLVIEDWLADLQTQTGGGLRVVLFSDHGNDFTPTRRVRLEDALLEAGFRPSTKQARAKDVVLPRFGLVSFAALFVAPESTLRLARALQGVEGVELLCFADPGGGIQVWSDTGRATVERDEKGGRLRYLPSRGDPLGLEAAREASGGAVGPDGWAPDSTWFRLSLTTPYVDGLRRIVRGVGGGVQHRASVLLSLAPGYQFGDPSVSHVVPVLGTHGSLRTAGSLAFAMATDRPLPPTIRSDDLRRQLGLPRHQ